MPYCSLHYIRKAINKFKADDPATGDKKMFTSHNMITDLIEMIIDEAIKMMHHDAAEEDHKKSSKPFSEVVPSPNATDEEIQRARAMYQTDDVSVDDISGAIRVDDGVWVAAWLWLPTEEQRCDGFLTQMTGDDGAYAYICSVCRKPTLSSNQGLSGTSCQRLIFDLGNQRDQ